MKFHDTIDKPVQRVITNSHIMFTASAPVNGKHVNLSPKGLNGTFKITGPNEVQYLDSFGSGCETLAHIRENGRVVLMFCTFQGDPLIVRLYGYGSAALNGTAEYDQKVAANFSDWTKLNPARCRAVITIKSFTITSSCGWAVPLMTYDTDRETLSKVVTDKMGEDMDPDFRKKLCAYGYSLDGLPGAGMCMDGSPHTAHWRWTRPTTFLSGWVAQNYQAFLLGAATALLVVRWSGKDAK